MEQSLSNTHFPRQKINTAAKTTSWFKKCIDSAVSHTAFTEPVGNRRRSMYTKRILRNLADGILDPQDIEKTTTYADFQHKELYEHLQNYPLSKPRIDLLIGESAQRRFDWAVRALNDDSISEKEDLIKDRLLQIIEKAIAEDYQSQQQVDEELRKLERWKRYELQDIRERRASHILTHLYNEQKMDLIFMQGMDNALVEGEEIYCTDIVGGEPIVRLVDPLSLYTIRGGNTHHLEDADIIIEDTYQPLGYIIDTYYDYLTPAQISKLERGITESPTDKDAGMLGNTYPAMPSSMFADVNDPTTGWGDFFINSDLNMNTPYDEYGNIRHTRVVWRSMRKLGRITTFDPDGTENVRIVSELYEPNEELGEKVEWFWVNEWMEGTRLGTDEYVKMQARPIQFRRMDNLSAGGSGYVGTIYPESLMEIMKPYQYLYILVMEQMKKAMKTFRPPMIELDLSKVPDDWTLEQWLYYAEEKGWLTIDSFNEGKKGSAVGKLAGSFNTTGKSYNVDMGNYINHLMLLLEFIERQLATISGVTDQRLGQIENRETVGAVERSVSQSSHITEKIFKMHENTKVRVLESLLETAKYAWRNKKSKKVQYVLDDLSTHMFEVDGKQFNESEYGVFITNSSNDTAIFQSIKQLAQSLVQNDKMNVMDLMTILTSPSLSTMRRQLEMSQEERQQMEQQQAQEANQIAQQQIESRAALEQQKLAIDERNNIRDNETRLIIANSKENSEEPVDDTAIKVKEHMDKIALERDKLDESKRHNKATEDIQRMAKKTTTNKS